MRPGPENACPREAGAARLREVNVRVPRLAWRRLFAVAALSLFALAIAGCSAVGVDAPMSTVQPASDHADEIQSLYKIVFYLAAIVFVVIMIVSVWFTVGFRENGRRTARQFHGNARLEVLWTILPVVIVIIISVPTFDRIFAIAAEPPADALKVEVIGHQWWFEFRYLDDQGNPTITTANEMHVPAGRAVYVTLKSDDVIHSFWVPQLFGKTDLMPGHVNHLWFTAHEPRAEGYIGQCMELCGTSHANMRFRIFVDSPTDYGAWARKEAAARSTPSGTAAAGEAAFLKQPCIGCHTIQGTTAAGKIGPNLSHVGGRSTLAAGIMPNTPENLAKWIRNSDDSKPGSKMPPHPVALLNDQDLQAIVAYLQSLK
jgi:cytochrome c oxidase subunit II